MTTMTDEELQQAGLTREQFDEMVERKRLDKKRLRYGAKVFCVRCGADHKTLYRVGDAYMCKECKKQYLMDHPEE